MNNEEKHKAKIKEVYANLSEIGQLNTPDFYIMPKSVYNQIIKSIGHLQDYLRDARKGRDNWKKKYMELKK